MKKLGILLLLVLLASPLAAGVVYEIEVVDHEQSPPRTESITMSVEGNNLKMGIASAGKRAQGEMIYHGDRREMVMVDHENHTYFLMDKEQMQAIAGQMNQAMAQMQEALKNVPESQRAMVEKMMKQRMPQQQAPRRPSTEIRKTTDRATMNGYPTVRYEVVRDGQKTRELWVTDWKHIEGSDDVAKVFEDMADFMQEMMDSLGSMSGFSNELGDNAFEHMKELKGFPVVTRELADDGSLETESTLRSAKREALAPGSFDKPSTYKRQEMSPSK